MQQRIMIGIITSGTENYNLIKLCQKFNLPYCIIADTAYWPYQDKKIHIIELQLLILIKYAKTVGCTHIFLSPIGELQSKYIQSLLPNDKEREIVIQLFSIYHKKCLEKSLIGKLGYIGGYGEVEFINNQKRHKETELYIPNQKQQNTKQFKNPLSIRTKDVSMRTFFSRFYSNRNTMINKVIKFDLRYFKDANVDTIIPLNYEYFNYQKTISSFFNTKKQKFHKRDIVIEAMSEYLQKNPIPTKQQEVVTIHYYGSTHLLTNKKLEAIASNGGKYKLEYKQIQLKKI